MYMNGIVPPSPMYIAGLPKCFCPPALSAWLVRELVPHLVAEPVRGRLGLRDALARDLRRQLRQLDDTGVAVVETVEQHADHALARRDHAGAVAGVHSLGEQRDLECAH